jgi:hypothetical protein
MESAENTASARPASVHLPVLVWPLFMTVIVLVANLWGLVTGEWQARARELTAILASERADDHRARNDLLGRAEVAAW